MHPAFSGELFTSYESILNWFDGRIASNHPYLFIRGICYCLEEHTKLCERRVDAMGQLIHLLGEIFHAQTEVFLDERRESDIKTHSLDPLHIVAHSSVHRRKACGPTGLWSKGHNAMLDDPHGSLHWPVISEWPPRVSVARLATISFSSGAELRCLGTSTLRRAREEVSVGKKIGRSVVIDEQIL
ncbi:hypothetical protein J437_LFUL016748 [Ladona fulva]|uniref:Uncharacterized protein n=1 Tax=Ladona fulva TaxID=123851 RepID=A0A8K0P785_LADFU|nr:hypothetical protein J437_LFUL016748 [Ladona fulva]